MLHIKGVFPRQQLKVAYLFLFGKWRTIKKKLNGENRKIKEEKSIFRQN